MFICIFGFFKFLQEFNVPPNITDIITEKGLYLSPKSNKKGLSPPQDMKVVEYTNMKNFNKNLCSSPDFLIFHVENFTKLQERSVAKNVLFKR